MPTRLASTGRSLTEEIEPQRRIFRVDGVEVDILVGPGLAGVTAGASAREDLPPARDRTLAELPIELRVQLLTRNAARDVEIGGPAGQKEIGEVLQAVFDRAKARAITPALADVQRCLPIVALLRIERPQVWHVVEPALLGT